ncbi:Sodium/hydrogen exchanger 1 [Chamberlinius hualienensis]
MTFMNFYKLVNVIIFIFWFLLLTGFVFTNDTAPSADISSNSVDNSSETANGTTTNSEQHSSSMSTSSYSHDPVLPQKGEAEKEKDSSMSIFFVLSVIALCIMVVHGLIHFKFHYLPESVAVVFLGALIGLVLKLISSQNLGNWQKEEAFPPTMFFLILLPPIIFESGYNLHKGNFFQNIGSILVFAIFGTTISALVIGGGVYLLGLADVAYKLSFVESFAFGSLISAVDPVATLAIFHALDVDPILYMLVFGESVLNDAVSIVLTNTAIEVNSPGMTDMTPTQSVFHGIGRFFLMFFASAGIGVASALISALLLKHVDLRKSPSLEFGIMLVFAYIPYSLAEGIHLSGIMAILFCGIVMSHYTHFNLSPITQITMQQTFRTLAFIAEMALFAYLGMAIFSFKHNIKPALVVWSIILCLIGRACNIFPLAYILNYFREHKITKRMMFIMWFSGLRGAIAYALVLHLEFDDLTRHVLVTTTLIIIIFTILVLGGSTMPMMKLLQAEKSSRTKRRRGPDNVEISLSKTREVGATIDAEHLSELTAEEDYEVNFVRPNLKGFVKYDIKYLVPFFTRRFTQKELNDCKSQMTDLTNKWYQAIRVSPSESEEQIDQE